MARLDVILFGSPQVKWQGGDAIPLNRRKAVALLAYLVTTRQAHSRETLAALFWPEVEQARAFAYLRTTLWTLHSAFGHGWIDADRETVEIKGEVWSDVEQFGILSAQADTLAEAAALYHDDFLAGFTLPDCPAFDEWQFFQRERLRQEFRGGLDRLIAGQVAAGQFDAALPYAQQRLALDTLDEAAHRQLIRLYAWTGQWSAAQRQVQQCVIMLRDELAAEPDQETQALAELIQQRRAPAPPTAAEPDSAPRSPVVLPITPFVAREQEINEIESILQNPACRLLTLVGPGGTGKTRLAQQIAARSRYPDGACFVALAPLRSVENLVQAVADAVQFSAFGKSDFEAQMFSYLREKRLLLVLDNFEHLLDGADFVVTLLTEAPQIKILATSRENLQLQEEWIFETRGLDYPENGTEIPPERLEQYGAVQLFVQTARRAQSDFALSADNQLTVRRICQLVEGMPLALELAAAWLPVLAVDEIAHEIERSLDFLTTSLRNFPTRHRSLRAVFGSSWERLTPVEQGVLCKLALFRAGFTRSAAETVAGASLPVLLSLARKSLLSRSPTQRYFMHELLRQFAEEKLIDDPALRQHTIRDYITYYVNFLGGQGLALKGHHQIDALNAIETEIDNIRTAWIMATGREDLALLRGLSETLSLFYFMRNRIQESCELFGGTIDYLETRSLSETDTIFVAQLKVNYALALANFARNGDVQRLYSGVLPLFRSLDDGRLALSYLLLGALGVDPVGDFEGAEHLAEKALRHFQARGDQWGVACTLYLIGDIAHHKIDYAQSRVLFQQSLDLSRAIGNRWGEASGFSRLGQVAYSLGQFAEAERLSREALAAYQAVGDVPSAVWEQVVIADRLYLQGQYETAHALALQTLNSARQLGISVQIAHSYMMLAEIAQAWQQLDDMQAYTQEGLKYYRETDAPEGAAWSKINLCRAALDREDAGELQRIVDEILAVFDQTQSPWGRSAAIYFSGEAARLRGDYVTARALLIQSLQLAVSARSIMFIVRHLVGIASLLAQTGEPEQALELLALVIEHPATWAVTRERAVRLLADYSALVPEEARQAALDRGRRMTVEEVLARWS
ncbi:MAG: tetratricopeptide repeat protein [Chloroflexi bacterium]|nr:tetratricopeptide repeat protein [Chloroflexota bacterium]